MEFLFEISGIAFVGIAAFWVGAKIRSKSQRGAEKKFRREIRKQKPNAKIQIVQSDRVDWRGRKW